jgi:hypothetical protein
MPGCEGEPPVAGPGGTPYHDEPERCAERRQVRSGETEIVVARYAGYCYGVERALRMTGEALEGAPAPVATLGPIIHNPSVVGSLRERGVDVVDEVDDAAVGTLIVRTHGVSPDVIARARTRRLNVVDATCPFVSVARNGQLLPEVREVLKVMAARKLTLATGHSSPAEDLLLIREAKAAGVDRIIVTHPMIPGVGMSLDQMKEAGALGAYLELAYGHLLGANATLTFESYAAAIRAVGPDHVILSTDLGQPGNPLHPDGLEALTEGLAKQGFSQEALDLMTKTNPAKVLGLE